MIKDVIHFMLPKDTVMQVADQVNKMDKQLLHWWHLLCSSLFMIPVLVCLSIAFT